MEYKFKTGDKVRYIGNTWPERKGSVWTIVEQRENATCVLKDQNGEGDDHVFYMSSIELIDPATPEYKVGDEVWVLKAGAFGCVNSLDYPLKGQVIRVRSNEPYHVGDGVGLMNILFEGGANWCFGFDEVELYTGQDKEASLTDNDKHLEERIGKDYEGAGADHTCNGVNSEAADAYDYFVETVGIPSAPEEPDVSGFDIDTLIKESKVMMGKPGGIPIDCYFSDTVLDKMLEIGCGNKGDSMAWLEKQKFTVQFDLIGRWRLGLEENS